MAEPSAVEIWKAAKHGFDVWPDLLRWAKDATPHAGIEEPDDEGEDQGQAGRSGRHDSNTPVAHTPSPRTERRIRGSGRLGGPLSGRPSSSAKYPSWQGQYSSRAPRR